MTTTQFTQGERVHLDTDNIEWGRVCGAGTILAAPKPHSRFVLVNSEQVRADILVPRRDLWHAPFNLLTIVMQYGDYTPGSQDSRECTWELPIGPNAEEILARVNAEIERLPEHVRDLFEASVEVTDDPACATLEPRNPLVTLYGMALHYLSDVGADYYRSLPKPVVKAAFQHARESCYGCGDEASFSEVFGQSWEGVDWTNGDQATSGSGCSGNVL